MVRRDHRRRDKNIFSKCAVRQAIISAIAIATLDKKMKPIASPGPLMKM